MKKELTQDDCRLLYVKLLDEFLEKIEKIDKATPWSEREPEWWCNMNDLQRNLYERKRAVSLD